MTNPRGHRQGGFTLIEVMVAVTILVLMMAIGWGSVNQTLKAKKHFGVQQDRYREARATLGRIARDLESAYLSGNEDRTLLETRTFFIGDTSGDGSSVRFSSFSHSRLYAGANESDQTVVAYYLGRDPLNRSATALIRRETRRMTNEKWDSNPGEADAIFTDVKKFKLSYYDFKDSEWKDTWTTQGAEGTSGRLPERVRIELIFTDDEGREVKLTSQARILLQELLQFYAN